MTVSEPPDKQPPEDDTALLIAALNHAWTWYDAQVSRTLQVINYFFVASAVLATAYVGAINGKHYPLAAVVALAGIGLTAVVSLIQLRQRVAVQFGAPVLAELQGRLADRLQIDMAGMIGTRTWTTRKGTTRIGRIARSNISAIAFGLVLLVSIGALLYAVIR